MDIGLSGCESETSTVRARLEPMMDGRRRWRYRSVREDAPRVKPPPVPDPPAVLVTGGAGYVAGPLLSRLIDRGLRVIVLDNLIQGHTDTLPPEVELWTASAGDQGVLEEILGRGDVSAVFHFAGDSSVEASVKDPVTTYRHNVAEGLRLIETVARDHAHVPFILSSTAAVYGTASAAAIPEDAPVTPQSPYGETKRVLEAALRWVGEARGLRWAALRYFNAAGAEGPLRERHQPETHLIPNLLNAARSGSAVTVFGTDYPTADGTAVRDYVHISDLADGHLLALDHLGRAGPSGVFNLGSGRGHSVQEVVHAVSEVTGRVLRVTPGPRRPGDPPALVADIRRARALLGYEPRHSDITTIIETAWQVMSL